jgi:patatin-like phospholipase/acyl hydrolase
MAKPLGEKMPEARRKAFQKLAINPEDRVILSLDGGGMRGILTIQLLKKIEEVAGIPCYELFDMVAGTSTGGIIAGLIVKGKTAFEIDELYETLIKEVFDPRKLGDRFLNPPKYRKNKYREKLKEIIGDKVTLQDACESTDVDLLLTARDISETEEVFFTCFKQKKDGSFYGTYKDVLLRAVMEATMSAPTYFYPLERFVDGGVTTHNNPSLSAFIEAISYSTKYADLKEYGEYNAKKITLYSLGTGATRKAILPTETLNPKGNDLFFWLDWMLTETSEDASAVQTNTFRSYFLTQSLDYRRFQISIDKEAIKLLPDTDTLDPKKYNTKNLHDLDGKIFPKIDMADIKRFDLMKVIGQQMAEFIMNSGNCFKKDLISDKKNDLLISGFRKQENIQAIFENMSNPDWLDKFPA